MLLALIVLLLVLCFLYEKYTGVYFKFAERGIPFLGTTFPYGTSLDFSFSRKYSGYSLNDLYLKGKPHPYVGIFNMRQPSVLLRDPEMIQFVLAKEFSHFRNRQLFTVRENDPVAHHLFNLDGERWRALRTKLRPTFTSGKLKWMFSHFVVCAEALDKLLTSKLGSDVDIKDVFGRFTTDIICSCAFGLEVNSIEDSDNEFWKLSETLQTIPRVMKIKFVLLRTFPFLFKLIKIRLTPKKVETFLLKVIGDTVDYREKNNIKRNDFLDLLIQLKGNTSLVDIMAEENNNKLQPVEMTIELITAQCFVFFFAGFETSSSVQSFCLYELALHPNIQDRLSKEIEEIIEKHGGIIYQAIQEMEYLDMVISETLRKYPTLPILSRQCTKSISTPHGHRFEKGDRIIIPLWALHHDPEMFPKPQQFNPERFSPENKESIKPFSYLPFGEGPRICIGMRFGLMQIKMGLITILRKYRVEPSENTKIPLEYAATALLTKTQDPILLKLTNRHQS